MGRKHQSTHANMTPEEMTFFAANQFLPPRINEGELAGDVERRIEAMRKIAMDTYDAEESRRLSVEIGYLAQYILKITA